MNFFDEVWAAFREIDVDKYKTKNPQTKVDYITWAKVWQLIMERYPMSYYEFSEDHVTGMGDDGPSNTVMVNCKLTIVGAKHEDGSGGEVSATREMWLPVMESYGQFKAIRNPTVRDISDARMRCLVKCAAMFGLGLEMWAGEDMHEAIDKSRERAEAFAKKKSDYRAQLWQTALLVKAAFVDGSDEAGDEVREALRECSEEEKQDLWLAETKGGFFTQKEKEWIRSVTWKPEEDAA